MLLPKTSVFGLYLIPVLTFDLCHCKMLDTGLWFSAIPVLMLDVTHRGLLERESCTHSESHQFISADVKPSSCIHR